MIPDGDMSPQEQIKRTKMKNNIDVLSLDKYSSSFLLSVSLTFIK